LALSNYRYNKKAPALHLLYITNFRLSPVEGLGEEENTVNWYFSNYNNENSEPYIGPGGGALEVHKKTLRKGVILYFKKFFHENFG
jgi:hypothetical protein